MTPLALVLTVLSTGAPQARPEVITDVAEAIVSAVEETGHDVREAIELAELAVEESHLAPWVMDGRCNDPGWRATTEAKRLMRGTTGCDGGHALSAWQVHVYPGGPSKAVLLNIHDAALYVAQEWAVHPQRWSTWKRVRQQSARWRIQ